MHYGLLEKTICCIVDSVYYSSGKVCVVCWVSLSWFSVCDDEDDLCFDDSFSVVKQGKSTSQTSLKIGVSCEQYTQNSQDMYE